MSQYCRVSGKARQNQKLRCVDISHTSELDRHYDNMSRQQGQSFEVDYNVSTMEILNVLIPNREHRLRIATDFCTRGVLSTLTIVSKTDALQLPLLSFIQRKHAMEKGLTYVELYALLAVAVKEHHAQQLVEEKYKVKLSLCLKV